VRLRRRDLPPIFLSAIQQYELVPDSRFARGEWKASTRGYAYTLFDQSDRGQIKALAWHWHPGSGTSDEPHMHVYRDGEIGGNALDRLHFPSERIAFEAIVQFLITELGVAPLREDWQVLITSALERFVAFRTWPRSGGPLPDSN